MKNKFVSFFTQRRKELGYSQSKIANELGISDQAISNWERGITFPDISYLSDIAKALNTNVLSLITGKHQNINIKENVNFDIARFSQYLLKLRKNKKLTQSDLGKILGVSGQNISKFENGGFLPSIELLEKYAKYFNVSFLNIYYGLDDDELYEEIPNEIKPNKLKWLIVSATAIIIIALLIIIPIVLIEKHTVTVVLDDQNILVHKIKSNEKIELPQLPTKKGYDTSWDNADTLITEDKTFTVIYTPKKYTITYIFEDREFDNYVQEVTYDEEFVLYKPLNTTICEYTYQGNKIESGIYNYDHNIEILCKTTTLYQVTIILDKDNIKIQNVQKNEKIELPQLPTKKGYDTSWDNADTLITEDKTFTVIYTPKKYTITYIFEDREFDNYVQEVTYDEDFVLYKPLNTTICEYTYQGNKIESGIYNYDHNIEILCKTTTLYQVTVILDKDNIKIQNVQKNEKIELPQLPTKKGYDTSWDNADTLITEDKTFNVIYTPKKYTITYIFEDREFDNYVQEVTYDEDFVLYKPLNTTICEYTYQGNKIESGIYNYDYNIEILCKTTTLYQVTIILDKDNIKIQNVQKNEKIELPQLPTKKGYDTSWDNTDTLITEDKTFTVIYTPKKYTITYTFENNIVKEFTQEVTYGGKYVLKVPQVTNYSFVGYTYDGQVINNGIYEYDYNITIYGKFSNETYNVHYEFTNCRLPRTAGYGCLFTIEEHELTKFISNCPFSPNEYDNYKIIAWKDRDGNIYEVGKSYTYNYKRDVNLCPIFEYSGNAFEVVIENGEAKITKYNIPKITMLVIPDYIVIGDKTYKVTGIAEKTFQDIYFINLALSSNIRKISKNTFQYEEGETTYIGFGEIYYSGSLKEWFEIDFEEYIVSNKNQTRFSLHTTYYLVGDKAIYSLLEIPEGVETIKSYSCANFAYIEVTIPSSVHTIEEHAFINEVVDVFIGLENVENVHEDAFK